MNKKKKIFKSLIKNHVYFSITLVIIAFILITIYYGQLKERLVNPIIPNLKAHEIIRQDYTAIPSEAVESFHGWIEILNENLEVIYVKGNKLDHQFRYTEKELYNMLYDQGGNAPYYSLAPFQTTEEKTFHCLIKIPNGNLSKEIRVLSTPPSQMKIITELSIQITALFFLLFALSLYLYGHWMARKITHPLETISNGINNMADGHFQTRLSFKADYELAQIQEKFNLMAEKLEKAENEKRLMEESRQRLLVGLSHDLKTPITTIQGYAKVLHLGYVSDETQKQKYLNYILNKSNVVVALIEDVFELSKLESPDFPITTEFADLAEFAREIAAQYYNMFEEKQMTFQVQIPEKQIIICFHKKMLYRAISNILSNALIHNPPGTEIYLQLLDLNLEVQINVIDNGVGIPNDLRDLIFDPFIRGDQSRKSDGGTGLGLTIAKQVMEKHGGKLQLNTSDGNTEFKMILYKTNQCEKT
ncbi:ATP-binding protein [Microbacteriaceae bacterium 4G12]